MDSPFPGMDPYLELRWRSVHHRLITYAGDQLQRELPQRFRVEVEERMFVVGHQDGGRTVAPDVYVVERPHPKRPDNGAASSAVVGEPVIIEVPDEPVTETFLEIIDTTSGNKVTSAIEFLSPTNKISGDGNELYVRKQRKYRAAGVSQVEIDLTRQGDRGLVFPMQYIPRQHRALYLACVRRSWEPSKIEAYPLPLEQALPKIGVPLDHARADVLLDLQFLVTQCYRNGRYDDIDYRKDLQPPLPPEETAWAGELLQRKGLH